MWIGRLDATIGKVQLESSRQVARKQHENGNSSTHTHHIACPARVPASIAAAPFGSMQARCGFDADPAQIERGFEAGSTRIPCASIEPGHETSSGGGMRPA
jgi:hypothetical protein